MFLKRLSNFLCDWLTGKQKIPPVLRGRRKIRGLKAIVQRLLGKRSPSTLQLDLTYECNCDCRQCGIIGYKQHGRKELTLGEIKKTIDEAAEIGAVNVRFVGGEPGLRKDLAEMIRHAKQKGLFAFISTNGVLLEQKAKEYKKAGVDEIYVSIDSADPKTHDELRKHPGCFQKAIRGIRKSLRLGIETRITTVARKKHLDEVEKIIRLGKKLGVAKVRVLYPIPTGRLGKKDVLTKKEHEEIRKMLDGKFAYNAHEDALFKGCVAGVNLVNVSPYGDVKPCSFIPTVFGNVRKESLKTIWERIGRIKEFHHRIEGCRAGVKKWRAKTPPRE